MTATAGSPGGMEPSDFDGCHHQPVPDRADPAVAFCARCGQCIGAPSGGACTILGVLDDPDGPFGHEAAERSCDTLGRPCTCVTTCQWNGAPA